MTTISIDDRVSRRALDRLDGSFELAMIVLGVLWLALVAAALVTILPLMLAATAIWGAFFVDAAARLAIATHRRAYLRENAIIVLALAVPALRILRLGRFMQLRRAALATRGIHAVRAKDPRRSTPGLHDALVAHNALGYVICHVVGVVLLGSAAMYWLEGLDSYGHAVWSTTMLITTMGTGAWPESVAARVLSVALALYGFGVLAYVTGSLASWFLRRTHPRANRAAA